MSTTNTRQVQRSLQGQAPAQSSAQPSTQPSAQPSSQHARADHDAPTRGQATPSHEEIAKRAYEIWQRKGRASGMCQQNWREAEEELGSGTKRA